MGTEETSPEELKAIDPVVGIRVVVQSYFRGDFIALKEGEIGLTEMMDDAFVFDYVADEIPTQIHRLNKETGDYWIALPLDQEDAMERCDDCDEFFAVTSIIWDGKKRFACRVCETKHRARQPAKAG